MHRWARKSKTQFVKQERNTQNAIALLNYLKRIVPQQLLLRMQVFTKNFLSAKNATETSLNKKSLVKRNLKFARIDPGSSDWQALDLTTTLSEPI
jgi:hypothetical protein